MLRNTNCQEGLVFECAARTEGIPRTLLGLYRDSAQASNTAAIQFIPYLFRPCRVRFESLIVCAAGVAASREEFVRAY